MKSFLTAGLTFLLLATPHAMAADTRVELPFQELVNSPEAKAAGIDGSVRFYLAGQKTPAVVSRVDSPSARRKSALSPTVRSCTRPM